MTQIVCVLAGCVSAPTRSPAPESAVIVGAPIATGIDRPDATGSLPPATVARMRAHGITVARHDGARTVVISGTAPTVERLPSGLYRVTFETPDALAASVPAEPPR